MKMMAYFWYHEKNLNKEIFKCTLKIFPYSTLITIRELSGWNSKTQNPLWTDWFNYCAPKAHAELEKLMGKPKERRRWMSIMPAFPNKQDYKKKGSQQWVGGYVFDDSKDWQIRCMNLSFWVISLNSAWVSWFQKSHYFTTDSYSPWKEYGFAPGFEDRSLHLSPLIQNSNWPPCQPTGQKGLGWNEYWNWTALTVEVWGASAPLARQDW